MFHLVIPSHLPFSWSKIILRFTEKTLSWSINGVFDAGDKNILLHPAGKLTSISVGSIPNGLNEFRGYLDDLLIWNNLALPFHKFIFYVPDGLEEELLFGLSFDHSDLSFETKSQKHVMNCSINGKARSIPNPFKPFVTLRASPSQYRAKFQLENHPSWSYRSDLNFP